MSVCPPGYIQATTGSASVLAAVRHSLLATVLLVVLASAPAFAEEPPLRSERVPTASANATASADESGETAAAAPAAPAAVPLSPRMQSALAYVRARYKVTREALLPLFETVQWIARERGIDPLLIVALIGIESGFNAQARSAGGGHGLMQIIPRYHLDKIPDGLGIKGLMDPAVNVQVGAQILDEAIRSSGSTQAGLQSYNGSKRKSLFARRVLAERERLERGAP